MLRTPDQRARDLQGEVARPSTVAPSERVSDPRRGERSPAADEDGPPAAPQERTEPRRPWAMPFRW